MGDSKYEKARRRLRAALVDNHKSALRAKTMDALRTLYEEATGTPLQDCTHKQAVGKAARALADRDMRERFVVPEPPPLPGLPEVDDTPIEVRGQMIAFKLPHGCALAKRRIRVCDTIVYSNEEVRAVFGVRWVKGRCYPQPQCKRCRGRDHKKKKNVIGMRKYRRRKKREQDIEDGIIIPTPDGDLKG